MKLGLKWIIIFSFSLFKPDYNIAQGAQGFFLPPQWLLLHNNTEDSLTLSYFIDLHRILN